MILRPRAYPVGVLPRQGIRVRSAREMRYLESSSYSLLIANRLVGVVVALCGSTVAAGPAKAAPTALAVSYFSNNTGDPAFDPLGRGLADMLITDLGHVDAIQVVERHRLNDVLDELKLGSTEFIDPTTAAEMGKGLGAQYIVTGAFISIDPQLRIDGRVVDVATSKVVFSTNVEGQKTELFLLEKELAAALLEGIGVKASRRQAARMGRIATESFDAFQSWSNGLAAVDRGDIETAKRALEEALAADERFDAAKTLLEEIRKDIGRITAERRTRVDRNIGRLLQRVDQIVENKGPYDELAQILFRLVGDMPKGARALERTASKILEMKLDDSVAVQLGANKETINGLALAMYVTAAAQLRAYSDVLSYGQTFMKRYPGSIYFPSTQAQVERALTLLEKREAGKKQIDSLYAEADRRRAEMLCGRQIRRRRKVDACRRYLRLAIGTDDESDAVRDLLSHASKAVSRKQLEQIRADVAETENGEIAVERVDRLIKNYDRKVSRLDDQARRPLEDDCFSNPDVAESNSACERLRTMDVKDRLKDRAGRQLTRNQQRTPSRNHERDRRLFEKRLTRSYVNAARALFQAGRFKEGYSMIGEGLSRLPQNKELHNLAVDTAVRVGHVKSAQRALRRWQASGAKVGPRPLKEVRELPARLVEPEDIEPLVLSRLASELSRQGQAKRAADIYVKLATQHPDTPVSPHRRFWMLAGSAFADAGELAEARRAYREVIKRWPDTPEARTARSYLAGLPN